MATETSLRHPDEQDQMARFFGCTAEFKETAASGAQPLKLISKCAYEPYQSKSGADGQAFETEPDTGDQLLLPYWEPRIKKNLLVVLTLEDGTSIKRFTVLDAAPLGAGPSQTLVLITPK